MDGTLGDRGGVTPDRWAVRKAAFSCRGFVQPSTLVSCTRPMAAWMSVIRALNPTTSLWYCCSIPWLRYRRRRRSMSASATETMPPSPEVMFFVG